MKTIRFLTTRHDERWNRTFEAGKAYSLRDDSAEHWLKRGHAVEEPDASDAVVDPLPAPWSEVASGGGSVPSGEPGSDDGDGGGGDDEGAGDDTPDASDAVVDEKPKPAASRGRRSGRGKRSA